MVIAGWSISVSPQRAGASPAVGVVGAVGIDSSAPATVTLRLDLEPAGYRWAFVDETGAVLDSGTGVCRAT